MRCIYSKLTAALSMLSRRSNVLSLIYQTVLTIDLTRVCIGPRDLFTSRMFTIEL